MDILKMSKMNMSFFGVPVLDDVDFSVRKGEVHALLGENGAGKSTLMNILAGVYNKDSGAVEFDGKPLVNASVASTEAEGIAFVHQELNLFNDLKVFENIFLRKEITHKFGTLNKKAMIEKSRELFSDLGVDIDPTQLVSELDTGKKQLLEIAKSLFGHAKLLILDEPTTALNNKEIDHLFNIVNGLKEKGVSFIFISHKMGEIFTIADRYSVLRNGHLVGVGKIADITPEGITKLMVGESYVDTNDYKERELGEEILVLDKLTAQGFNEVSLSVKKGEIIGLTGLKGSGVSNLMRCIFGDNKVISGSIYIEGKKLENPNIQKSMRHKIAMVAANRKENSIIPDFTLCENTSIAENALSMGKFHIKKKKEVEVYEKYKDMLSIKANSPDDLITSLSGGNQQKVIIGRWLNTGANVLLLDNPTQGIDVGAKAEIYKLILQLAESGKTILVNTLEIPEIQKVADRCVVFYHGEVEAVLKREEITEENVMMHATGAINIVGGQI